MDDLNNMVVGNSDDAVKEIQELQSLIQNFMLDPKNKSAFRKLVMAIHPDTTTITTIDASYLDELIKTVNVIRDQVLSAA